MSPFLSPQNVILDGHIPSKEWYSQNIEKVEESCDIVDNNVEVDFYTKPIDYKMADKEDKSNMHWALCFYFPNSKRFMTHEAMEVDGVLKWQFSQLPLMEEGYKKDENFKAKCETSPQRLVEYAKQIKNAPYAPAFRNCQFWILEFAKKIGGEVYNEIKKTYIEEVEEFCDIVDNNVEVSFYTKPIDYKMADKEDESQRHWALCFYFSNLRRYMTHDATDVNGVLKWQFKQLPPSSEIGYERDENFKAKCKMSPKKLVEYAKRIKNKDYNAAFNNCQTWILEFASNIGGEVYNKIKEKKTYLEKYPRIGMILGGLVQPIIRSVNFIENSKPTSRSVNSIENSKPTSRSVKSIENSKNE